MGAQIVSDRLVSDAEGAKLDELVAALSSKIVSVDV
jgi:hypothetical protein